MRNSDESDRIRLETLTDHWPTVNMLLIFVMIVNLWETELRVQLREPRFFNFFNQPKDKVNEIRKHTLCCIIELHLFVMIGLLRSANSLVHVSQNRNVVYARERKASGFFYAYVQQLDVDRLYFVPVPTEWAFSF